MTLKIKEGIHSIKCRGSFWGQGWESFIILDRGVFSRYTGLGLNLESMDLQILIQRDEDGKYIASCPALRGCHAQGDTYEEALLNIKEAIELNLEHLVAQGKIALEDLKMYPKFIATEEISIGV